MDILKEIIQDMNNNFQDICNDGAQIREGKEKACVPWVYHCTNIEALESIIDSKTFYLKNIYYLNDEEEKKVIYDKKYENTFYVGSFSKKIIDTDTHNEEYGSSNAIYVGMKREWFLRDIVFKDDGLDNCYTPIELKICNDEEEAINYRNIVFNEYKNRVIAPFYIKEFEFLSVDYIDEYKEKEKKYFAPQKVGIIKNKIGVSCRTGNTVDWSQEEEIRLKVCIHQLAYTNEKECEGILPYDYYPRQVAVKLSEGSFDKIYLYFSKGFKNKEECLAKLNRKYKNIIEMDSEGIKL